MSEPKFTKGPWNHVRYEHDDYPQDDYSYIVNPEGKEICVMDYCGGDDYNNADLIASSPELYDFVHFFETFAGQCYCKILGESGQKIYDEAVRLCKKARGEE